MKKDKTMKFDPEKTFWTSDTHHDHGNIIKYSGRVKFMTDEDRALYDAALAAEPVYEWVTKKLPPMHSSVAGPEKVQVQVDPLRANNFKISIESIRRMNDGLVEGINEVVGEDDTLLHLGDFSFSRDEEKVKAWRDKINCKNIILIYGNHDRKGFLRSSGMFKSCHEMFYMKMLGLSLPIICCHYAMRVWDRAHHGAWHLYGHSHEGLEKTPWGKSMDVGVDCHYDKDGVKDHKPFSFAEIKEIMDSREYTAHH